MKSVTLSLVAIAFALMMIACNNPAQETTTTTQPAVNASPVSTATPDEFAAARVNFAKHCSVCHGDDGNGGPVTIEGKSFKVPSLRQGHAVRHSDEALVKQINNGEDEMPPFKDKLSAQEIDELVRFIRKELQTGK
jgi:mono/diheme cytochrome c family protein